MIVDCHTHIDFATDSIIVAEQLAATETVDMCIVLATANRPSEQTNKKLSEHIHKHKQKLIGFAVIDPTKDDISSKNLTFITEKLGLKGIVLYCCVCGFHPAHSRAMAFYEIAEQLSLPIFFHNSSEPGVSSVLEYSQPYLLDEVARTFPNLKMIIGTMGMPFYEQTLSVIAKHKNVYADLTIKPGNVWQIYNTVMAAYERGVMDKLLFGSGFPFGDAGQCIETLLGFNKLLADTNLPTVPRGSIRNIIERDALKLLGISL